MLIFISGGVRSGKSSLGERIVSRTARGRKLYLATSEVYDDEIAQRIEKHRLDRAGKGFDTIEQSRDISAITNRLQRDDAVLLDCLGTLAANEMFGQAVVEYDETLSIGLAEKIYNDIVSVHAAVSTLVVISNELFSDGIAYDLATLDYVRLMGKLHCMIAEAADAAIECACNCVMVHKGSRELALIEPRV